MTGLLKSIFGSGASTLANGDRLNQEAEVRNRANRIRNMDALIGGTGEGIGLLQEQQEQRAKRKENKGRQAELENIKLRARVQMLNEALDRAEEFARHKYLESESLRATISHLSGLWGTPELQEMMTDHEKMGGLMYEKGEEVRHSPERQEKATRIVDLISKRPEQGGRDNDLAR